MPALVDDSSPAQPGRGSARGSESSRRASPRLPTAAEVVERLNQLPAPLIGLIAGLGYFGAAFLGYATEYAPIPAPAIWPAAGIAACFYLVVHKRAIGWVAAGVLLAELSADCIHGRGFGVALGFALATLAYIPAAIWVRGQGIVERGLIGEPKDVAIGSVGTAAAALANGALALAVAALAGYGDLGTFFLVWTLGVYLGLSVVTPLLIPNLGLRNSSSTRPPYLSDHPVPIVCGLLALLLGSVALLFGVGPLGTGLVGVLAPFVSLPICLVAPMWLAPRPVAVLLLAVALEIVLLTANGLGPFAKFSSGPAEAVFLSQIVVVILLVTSGICATIVVQLRATEERYEHLLQDAPGMTIAVEPNKAGSAKLVNCNRAFLELIGRDREEAIGQALEDLVPRVCSAVLFTAADFRRVAERRPPPPKEVEIVGADGAAIPVLMQAAPYIDDSANVAGMQVTYLDLSDRQRAEALERDNQLIQQQRLALLGTLTAGIAHEVKNPLNFVVNFAEANNEITDSMTELLAPRLAEFGTDAAEVSELLDDLHHNADAIHKHADRALDIMMSMLQLSRPGSGEAKPSDLNTLAERYAKLAYHGLRAEGREATTQIEFDLDPDLPQARVVQADIGRVILNLVGNACEAAGMNAQQPGKGGQPVVRISTAARDEALELRVADNGPGIPKDIREKIFEPFFTTKEIGAGTGLGLSISKDIVEQHNGSIAVRSSPGELTEFVVTLPLSPEQVVGTPVGAREAET